MSYKAVLLDMDGLMFDTERLSDEIWLEVSKEEKYPILPSDVNALRGRNLQGCKEVFLKRFGDDFPFDELSEKVNTRISETLKTEVPIKPGLVDFLKAVKDKGIPVAVASSTHRELVLQNLKVAKVDCYIDAVVGGDEVENSKPAPEIFLKAAQLLNVSAHDCIAFEDSQSGIRAANAAGCSTVMVPDCDPPTAELKRMTSFVVKDLYEAIALIK